MEIRQENESWSEIESTGSKSTPLGSSGPLSGPISGPLVMQNSSNKSERLNDNLEEDSVELTFSIQGDDPETALLARRLEKRSYSLSFRLLRQVSQKLKQIKISSKKFDKVDRTESGAARALRSLRFLTEKVEKKEWSKVEKSFDENAFAGKLPKTKFSKCIEMKEEESQQFANDLFDALCRRRGITSTFITKDQFRQFWEQITDDSFDSRLHTFFDMVDKNADGRITKEEVKEIINLSAYANKLSKIQERAEEYAAFIMEELDPDNLGYIELNNLEMLLLEAPTKSTHIITYSRVLSQLLVTTKEQNPLKQFFRALFYFIEDNWKRIWVIALWLSICAAVFTWKFIQYKHHHAIFDVMGYCITSAKGAAETLKFNMALILLPVCRNTITWLRSKTKLGTIVPFDDNINFHKEIAFGIAIGVGIHAISHLTCDFPRLLHATNKEYEPLKAFFGEERPNNYWWFMKGTEGWTGIVMVVLMTITFIFAQPWFRKDKLKKLPKPLKKLIGFNTFWYSHHLFVIVYALFVVHGYYLYLSKKWYKKTTWMYLAVPMILYACERLLRAFRSGYKNVKILKFAVYPAPAKALALRMSKPQGFKYSSGQYIFIKCSDVSPFQWHPFSITSAPTDDYISVHIRASGDWTTQLVDDIFSKVYQPTSGDQSGLLRVDMLQDNNIPKIPKLLIDGPYGAPSQDYKNYEVILLVGLGIGATPFISIVKDVLNNIKQQKDIENGVVESGVQNKRKAFATKHAYFYWVTREQGSFEWFKRVMEEVAEKDHNGVIELHNYCTSVYEEGDARSALITMLQSLQYAKNGVDIVSGTRVKTHFARPNWRSVFKHVALKHPGKRVGVFYCGRPTLVGELKKQSVEFSRKTNTKFDFHKENF